MLIIWLNPRDGYQFLTITHQVLDLLLLTKEHQQYTQTGDLHNHQERFSFGTILLTL